jgi:integrase/recombinase XerD
MTITTLTTRQDQTPTTTNVMTAFGAFLRLHVADGDASPATFRSYHSNAGQFVAWRAEHGINPATAIEDDIATYRKVLVARCATGTVAVKLAAIRRLYEAAQWRGLRQDNPAAGLRAPTDKTERAERKVPSDGRLAPFAGHSNRRRSGGSPRPGNPGPNGPS